MRSPACGHGIMCVCMCHSLCRTQSTDETTPKRRDTVGSLSRWATRRCLDVHRLFVTSVKM